MRLCEEKVGTMMDVVKDGQHKNVNGRIGSPFTSRVFLSVASGVMLIALLQACGASAQATGGGANATAGPGGNATAVGGNATAYSTGGGNPKMSPQLVVPVK